jgi:hypothetical protein
MVYFSLAIMLMKWMKAFPTVFITDFYFQQVMSAQLSARSCSDGLQNMWSKELPVQSSGL